MRHRWMLRDPVERALTAATLAVALSTGVFFAVSALYFTRVVGLDARTIGLGLTIGGAVGVVASYVSGSISDRWGADRILIAASSGQGVGLLAYSFVSGTVAFIAVACWVVGTRGAAGTANAALLARWFAGSETVAVRARLRVVLNVGIGVGTGLAGIALAVDTVAGYRVAMVAVGTVQLLAILPLLGLRSRVPGLAERAAAPRGTTDGAPTEGRSPLRDRTYLTVVGLNAVMGVQFALLTVAMPLWVAGHTAAPTVMISVLLVINTLLVVLWQIPASRGTDDVPTAGRVVRRAGVLLAVASGLYVAAGAVGTVVATVLLLAAIVAATGGEVWGEAGRWGLAFELADPVNAGAYQGVSQTGYAIAMMMGPLAVTATAIDHGPSGWAILAALFIAAGAAVAEVARRAPTSRLSAAPDRRYRA